MSRTRYEFRVTGRVSERVRHAFGEFGDMRIVPAAPETIIYGDVVDDSYLYGILAMFQNLGLHVVSMHTVPDPAPDTPEVH
ncbi:hypothetical protein LWC34_05055 [Kibdelosporangium philippinense]|uniref:Uncharacterized protein n=1 Tax=Kibdelosporangium philippinense TaxID=211113 RepID=A0ABS8Z479_9PSEU|nr:hypothetical protein [Kibdelosporangium philippinense]MCE7002197.1 hypothetical protein [Kibdelosporangium philippinense]